MTRFEFSNHNQVTKLDKSEYNALKKAIFSIFQKLGKYGTAKPVAYDTAWAARVPKFEDLAHPAFPQCLQWLRDHQKEDGSWGDDYPPSIHSKILNSLAAVLALSQWKSREDEERTQKGVNAIWELSEALPKEQTESLTFEMLLSALVDDGHVLGLDLPYERFERLATSGRDAVKKFQSSLLSNRPNRYWAILEAAGKTLELHPAYYRSELKRHGLIATQPSTTAFILREARLKGENYIESEWILEQLSLENGGGLPHLHFCDNFDLIHGLDFLTKVGINPSRNDKHDAAKNATEILKQRWDPKNGIGFSSNWLFTDHTCTKSAVSVLKTLDEQEDVGVAKLEKYIDDTIMDTKLQNGLAKTTNQSDAISSAVSRLKATYFLSSARSVSKYYHYMRTVFEASTDTRLRPTVQNICNEIARSQNSDGGWGGRGTSSAEETAYVCVTVFELIRHSSKILYMVDFLKLVEFIQNGKPVSENENLWNWKVSFSSPGVTEAAVVAAKYAVFQIQRFCILTNALNDYKLDFDEVGIFDEAKVIFQGDCLRFQLKGLPENNENRERVEDKLMKVFDKGLSPYLKSILQTYVDFSYLQHPFELSLEHRTVDLVAILFVVLMDDTVDLFDLDREDMAERLSEFFRVVIAILGDESPDLVVPDFDTPGFSDVSKFLFFLRDVINENGWDCKNYVKELRGVFDANISVRRDLRNNIEPTVKRFLQIHKISACLKVLVQQDYMIDGIAGSESENLALSRRFVDSACKACRMWGDFLSVLKDAKLNTLDNYCLRLQHQYKVSVQKAIQMAVKKSNKEILKMYALKTISQKDSKYVKYTDLPLRMKYVDIFVDGTLIWAIYSYRYKSEWTNKIITIPHQERDVTFVRNLCFDL